MSLKTYERQHLACFASGAINAAGTSQVNFGCQLTRISAGHYGLVLDADNNLVNDESFTFATPKGSADATTVVEDTSNAVKAIRVFNDFGTLTDTAIEVALFRSVTR